MTEDYLKARKMAEKEYRARLAKGEYPFVVSLDSMLPGIDTMSRQALGLMEIPVSLIAGTWTQARQNSFAANFMPLLEGGTEFEAKWDALYAAQISEGFNEPIRVYEYLSKFYVLEGNKRVSVARYLDMPTIMADVTRLTPDSGTLAAHPVYAEFLEFWKRAPIYDIICERVGSYRGIAALTGKHLENVREPRDARGTQDERWPEELVRSLRTAYWRFSEAYRTLRDKLPEMSHGDAFAIYLRIYASDGIHPCSGKELEKRLLRIRRELMTEYNRDRISLIESSEEALKAGSLLGKVLPSRAYSTKHPLRAAFIYDRSPEESDWTYNHESGRVRAEKAFDGLVETRSYVAGIPGEAGGRGALTFDEAAEAAAGWGADVIFTTSVRQMDDALRAAIRYDGIRFLNCSINLAHQAVRTYYARLYEAKFLAGLIAGSYSAADGSHIVGYCSDHPVYGTIAAINAFATGVSMTDPAATVHLDWSGRQDSNWWWSMVDKGIHVISAVDSKHNKDGSNAYGLCYVEKVGPGEGTDLSGMCRVTNLAAPIWKWGKMYEILLRTLLDGSYSAKLMDRRDQATNYWWGMASGVVDIDISPEVPEGTRRLAETLREDIIDGRFDPFDGKYTSSEIITMDELRGNIIGSIPAAEDFNEVARLAVDAGGTRKS